MRGRVRSSWTRTNSCCPTTWRRCCAGTSSCRRSRAARRGVHQRVAVPPSGINAERVVYREAMPAPDEQRSVILEYNMATSWLFPGVLPRGGGVRPRAGLRGELGALAAGRLLRVALRPRGGVTVILSSSGGSMQSRRDRMAAGEEMALRKTLARLEQQLSPRNATSCSPACATVPRSRRRRRRSRPLREGRAASAQASPGDGPRR
ncbi:hypothetical protein QJS66_07850 [Kocuria rhizophila]|nr:hypothetical protein QJS66_07850 [Kocuria rhizophila]